MGEGRYTALKQHVPCAQSAPLAAELFARPEKEAAEKYDYYKKLAEI